MLKKLYRVGICAVVFVGICLGQGKAPARGRGATAPVDPNASKGVYPTLRGVLKSISGSLLLLEIDDEQEMKFRMTRKTKIFAPQGGQGNQETKASSLHPGQTISIDMQSGLDGAYEAVRITVESPKQ